MTCASTRARSEPKAGREAGLLTIVGFRILTFRNGPVGFGVVNSAGGGAKKLARIPAVKILRERTDA